jgi:hypothetical protein
MPAYTGSIALTHVLAGWGTGAFLVTWLGFLPLGVEVELSRFYGGYSGS